MRQRRLGRSWVVFLTMALAACGSGGSSGGPSASATPAPSTTPLATSTPAAEARIEPVLLLEPDAFESAYPTGVNARGWVSIHHVWGDGPLLVLAPGAGPGEPPLPGCPVGAGSPSCARTDVAGLIVGESDWYVGSVPQFLGSTTLSLPAAFGPGGEVVLLVPCCDGIEVSPGDILPVPGPRFLGSVRVPDPANPKRGIVAPVLWRTPGDVREQLPIDGFASGASANAADAGGRIAGEGRPESGRNDRVVPVVWLPRGDAYEVEQLPLLEAGTNGSALAIDTGQVAGWSDGSSGRSPVVWETKADGGWTVRALPIPPDLDDCAAVATSGARIAGVCTLANLDGRGIVWRRDGDAWHVEARLLPYPEIDSAYVRAMSGDLVVGDSHDQGGFLTPDGPVSWRLPAEDER